MKQRDFNIESVMIHDVPRGGSDITGMTLTDAPINLDDALRKYFRSKITDSLSTRGVEVTLDPNQDPTVGAAVTEIIANPASLPEQSKRITSRLYSIQTGVNPAGLLTVISGTSNELPAVAVLKLEREEGIRFEVHEVDGHVTVDLEFLRDLTLTNKTKVFKTSLFVQIDQGVNRSIFGIVSDDQRGQTHGRGVADFFLTRFLGCRLRNNPAQATLKFVKAAEEFFNAEVINPETRGRYQVALLSTMQDQQLDVTPREFANLHLDTADRSGFLDRVSQNDLLPDAAFEKDTSLVKVRGFRMTFENGMVLVGSPDDLRERVHMRNGIEGQGVDINDAVKQLQGR